MTFERPILQTVEMFSKEFQPNATLLIGADGISLEDFLNTSLHRFV